MCKIVSCFRVFVKGGLEGGRGGGVQSKGFGGGGIGLAWLLRALEKEEEAILYGAYYIISLPKPHDNIYARLQVWSPSFCPSFDLVVLLAAP